MPDDFEFPFTVNIHEQDTIGLGQGVQVNKSEVYEVTDIASPTLITTSGRIGTTTLDETTDYIIANMGGRNTDWVITLRNVVQRIIHPDDSISNPVSPG